jgi:hypothetical protein
VNAIAVGVEGRIAMLKAIFGSSEEPAAPPPSVSSRPLTPALFGALFQKG